MKFQAFQHEFLHHSHSGDSLRKSAERDWTLAPHLGVRVSVASWGGDRVSVAINWIFHVEFHHEYSRPFADLRVGDLLDLVAARKICDAWVAGEIDDLPTTMTRELLDRYRP